MRAKIITNICMVFTVHQEVSYIFSVLSHSQD